MKTLGSVVFVLVALTAVGQRAEVDRSPFVGTWHCKQNDLPAVTLVVQETGGKLTGTIVFYLQKRDTEDQPWRVEGGAVEVLINPRVVGRDLSFEVRHHASHDSPEYGPNVVMTVEVTGPGRARLGELELVREP